MSAAVRKGLHPISVCSAVRRSFLDAAFVYKNGSCFEFYLILRAIFPTAEAWTNIDHVWAKIDGKFYDIDGERKEGAAGLFNMMDDKRMYKRAHGWSERSSWRIDEAKAAEGASL